MADDKRGEIHINIGDQAGGDHLAARDVSGSGVALGRQAAASAVDESWGLRQRTARVYEDELIAAIHHLRDQLAGLNTVINDLRNVNAQLQTKVALLEFQVAHLNDRLRSTAPTWGPLQWMVIFFVIVVATIAAVYVGTIE